MTTLTGAVHEIWNHTDVRILDDPGNNRRAGGPRHVVEPAGRATAGQFVTVTEPIRVAGPQPLGNSDS